MNALKTYRWGELDDAGRSRVLTRPAVARDQEFVDGAQNIINAVRKEGDRALLRFTEQFDQARLETLAVAKNEFQDAENAISDQAGQAIRSAAANIRRFHQAQLGSPLRVETSPGVVCERVTRPLGSVGLYVPAGTAPLPSTALMLCIPATLAQCPVISLCTPARRDGTADPAVLVAAREAGVDRVFKIGGAQAIGAMAYGTESVPKADKIFGPGNAWVTAAKALVSKDPRGAAVDFPAGPSEVMVIADQGADPDYVATDLLSQAEHGPDSQVLLITTSETLGESVQAAVKRFIQTLSRASIIEQSLGASSILLVDSLEQAVQISNDYAPEHLILQIENPRNWIDQITNAGSVFLGAWSPESIGDYCSGTNHVLPTYGAAKSYGSLGTTDFQRAMTIQELTREGLEGIGPTAEILAALEGLDAHALAVSTRLRSS